MKLIECPNCKHGNHPVKGKPKPFRDDDGILRKSFRCGGCKTLLTIALRIGYTDKWDYVGMLGVRTPSRKLSVQTNHVKTFKKGIN